MPSDTIPAEYRRFVEDTYSLISKNDEEKILDNLIDIMALGMDGKQPLRSVLEHVERFVFRQWGFGEIAIGLKDKREDIWKYEVTLGFPKAVELKLARTRYDRADMYSQEKFPNIKTGRLSELNVAEGLPIIETDRYDRPFKWGAKRTDLTDFLPGDFLDFWMLDDKKEIIGWIEVSSPKGGKQPPRATVRWLELVASICSEIVRSRYAEEAAPPRLRTPPSAPTTNGQGYRNTFQR